MPRKAQIYITLMIAAAALLAAQAIRSGWPLNGSAPYLAYLALALVASTLKVRLPGLTGTISLNFLLILISVAEFSWLETTVLACTATLVQCLYRPKRRPSVIQVLFNVAALAISSSVAYQGAHMLVASSENLPVLMAVASSLLFVSNTSLVSVVLTLIAGRPLRGVWEQCYLWTLPYYLVGGALAGLVVVSTRAVGWQPSFLILPVMFLVYLFYRWFAGRASASPIFAQTEA